VRFGEEVTGLQQLGTTERGENMKIGTYIEQSIDHELSANIIDLCPVGALNNKPYRYSARAWEMVERSTISPHDCVGSNMNAHVLRGTVKRVVPRENETINETWLSDRDRFSYEGIYSHERLLSPRLKSGDAWEDVTWEEALGRLADELKSAGAERTGILAAPGSTIEEFHLLAKLAEHLGTANIDHRIRQRDFSGQESDPLMPWLGCNIEDIEMADAILVVGSNIRKEAPIIAHRVRKAALGGAKVSIVNSSNYEVFFDTYEHIHGLGLVRQLAGVVVAAAGSEKIPAAAASLCNGIEPTAAQKKIAESLANAANPRIIAGLITGRHNASHAVRTLVAALGELTGASTGTLSEGSNSAGAHLAGVLPHRAIAGELRRSPGMNAAEMLAASLDAVLLFGLEPDADLPCVVDAEAKLAEQKFVVALTPFNSASLQRSANLMLPIGTFAETSGTYVNCEGRIQSFGGIANPVGEARPGWKVLRVIGNLLDAQGFDYLDSEQIRDDLLGQIGEIHKDNSYDGGMVPAAVDGADEPGDDIDVPIYQVDAVVRRARALQLTPEAQRTAGRRS
jgi:NADH-quinone oxidoreductase subunit G